VAAAMVGANACRSTPHAHDSHESRIPTAPASLDTPPDPTAIDASVHVLDAAAAEVAAPPLGDPMQLHRETREELLSLFSIQASTEADKARLLRADAFLRSMFAPDDPRHANQGNKALARHSISKEQCLEGLKDIVIQTPEQFATCGAENMVPVWSKGNKPSFCIDVFEFPNKACELPMVWTQPPLADKVCKLQGKRLCSDLEWNLACRGDPSGGPDQRYAYGNELDLEVCHTNLRHSTSCSARDATTAWRTCATDTEPSGAFPRCRSRFGVFDQHGNVAEVMTRREGGKTLTQLKGSAWFYVELAKEPKEPPLETTTNKKGAYPDHCNFDPRWHVEPLETALHVNYHLGFRCCKALP
ncbi:MAG TPA: SUMF1/EgtB/PvdO family nonheme iron enzyme, partial [Labilithrix sp.]|nr:SUMF1/EgtB/PvdO family nonheme iron enzyme [Labilithrix sp.]